MRSAHLCYTAAHRVWPNLPRLIRLCIWSSPSTSSQASNTHKTSLQMCENFIAPESCSLEWLMSYTCKLLGVSSATIVFIVVKHIMQAHVPLVAIHAMHLWMLSCSVSCCRLTGSGVWAGHMSNLISDCSQASWLGMTGSPIGKQRGQPDGFKCVEMITQAPASTCDADWKTAQLGYNLGCECILQLQLCQGTKERQHGVTTSLHVCVQT